MEKCVAPSQHTFPEPHPQDSALPVALLFQCGPLQEAVDVKGLQIGLAGF